MGIMPGEIVDRAAKHLLGMLIMLDECVLYSQFYDGRDETRHRLIEGIRPFEVM
jgi:hypothetical protein